MDNEEDLVSEEEETMSPLAAMAEDPVRQQLLEIAKKREEERSKLFQAELDRIEAAKQKLLAQPTELSRREMLRALANRLTQRPTDQRDPRFWERQNLFTMLRDVGEFSGDISATEKKLKEEQAAKIAQLEEMRGKYLLGEAERGATQATSALARYRPPAAAKEPAKIQADRTEAEARGLTLRELYEQREANKMLLAGRSGGGAREKFVSEFQTLSDSTATPAQKSAALARLPPDVRKNYATSSKSGASYLDRIEQLQTFTVPDIDEAISMVEANPTLAAGNFAAWLKGKPVIGQKATDLDNTLQVIRAAVGFEKLEELKKLSPYGASGLGAVSNAEQKLLQSVKGSLEQDNSSKNLLRNLNRLKDFYNVRVPQMMQNYGIDIKAIREGAGFDMFGGEESAGAETPPAQSGSPIISPDAIRAERERRRKEAGGT